MDSSDAPGGEVLLAQAIAAAVRTVPGVAELSPGRFAEVATYGTREKVPGVVVKRAEDALAVEVHVCAQYADSLVLDELASRVRQATRQAVEPADATRVSRIDVVIDDMRIE
jgi:uncharacterized alkaline shock family protein YloU